MEHVNSSEESPARRPFFRGRTPRRRIPHWLARCVRGFLGLPGLFTDQWQPSLLPPGGTVLDRKELLEWIHRSDQTAGMLAMEPGMHRFVCADGLVGYGVWRRTAFIAGGIHPASGGSGEALLKEFWSALQERGFRRLLCVPVRDAERAVFEAAGGETLLIGAEAIVDLSEFTLEGPRRENLRQMCRRATRNGVVIEEIPVAESMAELGELHARWTATRPRGYRMALLVGDPGLGKRDGRRFFAARERDGTVQSFVTVHAISSGRGAAIDALVRHESASPGAVDLLIQEMLQVLKGEGVEWLSLGACPLIETRAPGDSDSRVLRFFLRGLGSSTLGDSLFSFQGLHQFKSKFHPRWEPIHMGGFPNAGFWAMYAGGRMWGLTGRPRLERSAGD